MGGTAGTCYLLDLGARGDARDRAGGGNATITDRLEFQVQPTELKRAVVVKWNATEVPGFSHRRLQYVSGGERGWRFKLQFFLDDDDDAWVHDRIRWLESFTLAEFDDDGRQVAGPRHLLLVWGDLFSAEVILQGPLNTTYALFDPDTKRPRMAEVDVNLEEFVTESVDFRRVRP